MSMSKIDEREIVNRILKGDEKALRKFYRYFKPSLMTFISRRVDKKEDCEEILQDTLLASIEALRDFSFRSSLFTFVCAIAKHKIVDFYRKKKIKKIVFSQLPQAEFFFSTLFRPGEELDDKYVKAKIKQTFAQIPRKYSRIIKLKYIYGYTVKEIARMLSISFKSAESRLFRARRAFARAYLL